MKYFLMAVLATISVNLYAQDGGSQRISHDTVTTDSISVSYGRPHTNGQTIFGNLQKYGKIWKAGADGSTTITFAKAVNFGGTNVAAGTYTLFVIPQETEWTIILNSKLGSWGAMSYDKYKDQNVAQVDVPVTTLTDTVEQLTIRFPTTTSMIIEWDKTQVTIPIL